MKRCHQEFLAVDYFFKELDPMIQEQYRRHLADCPVCQSHIRTMAETQRVLKHHRRNEPDRALLRQYQFALAQRFEMKAPSWRWFDRMVDSWIRRPSMAVRLVEAIALILIGFFIGSLKNWLPEREPAVQIVNEKTDLFVIESPLLKNYLQQTEMIFLDVKNLDPVEDHQIIINLVQSVQYRYLLQKSLLLREQARELNNQQLAELLNRIELILLELENVGMSGDVEILSLVQQQLKDTRLLFQIKAVNMEEI